MTIDGLVEIALSSDICDMETQPSHGGEQVVTFTRSQYDAIRAILLTLKLADLLEQGRMIRAFPKLVAACHAALSVEGLPTPIRKQIEKAIVVAE